VVDEILGGHIDDRIFIDYLNDWQNIMEARIRRASDALRKVPGVEGLILSGSNGLGTAWALSDIDLTPIYDESQLADSQDGAESVRLALLDEWSGKGWRTGVDVGRLYFGVDELTRVFANGDPDPVPLLRDDRWYHSIDKAYGGRALFDRDGLGERLAKWFAAVRFSPEVIRVRLDRSAAGARESLDAASEALHEGDRARAFSALLKSIQWRQIHLMERWGQRDNSLGRFGTRFEREARERGVGHIPEELDRLASLTDAEVQDRLTRAPWWVRERRDRSWAARRERDEPATALQNDRDVLRVCTIYELRLVAGNEFPDWLAVPDPEDMRARIAHLEELVIDRG
jgi:hypothetical protein